MPPQSIIIIHYCKDKTEAKVTDFILQVYDEANIEVRVDV